ncbi:MAG: tyrosine-type recombinase/integrase [Cyanobacteria bacterium P01_A01_bin.17]
MGKTPVLNTEEMRQLLESFDTTHMIGLRDRAIISLMTFTFARIGAVVAMDVEDYFPKASRHQVRLHEKGGKYLEMPLHYTANDYLHAYIEAAARQLGTDWAKGRALFRAQQRGRLRLLSDRRFDRRDAWAMIKRRVADAKITTNASPLKVIAAQLNDL